MSGSSGSRKTLAGWTMVDSKGEMMTDDSSISSDSSTESFSLLPEVSTEAIAAAVSVESPSEEVNDELKQDDCLPTISSCTENEKYDEIPLPGDLEGGDSLLLPNQLATESLRPVYKPDKSLVESDGGLGACCEELMEKSSGAKNLLDDVDAHKEEENEGERDHSSISSIPRDTSDSIPGPSYLDYENRKPRQRHNSDSDSDFVQINEDNLEEIEAELANSRDGIPDRSPSIAEGFNFLGPAGEGIRDAVPGSGNASDRDMDLDQDFNEDTESSTEDVFDDRIESDQSDVGSIMNSLTDVGDLSAFADIGDLPLEAGNVARNYCHRPNKGLSAVLNIILIVVSLLTMGISIGLIMATDLEIEEWQNAYNMQAKKASSLEWTLNDLNKVVLESKDKANAYESVLKTFSKAENENAGSTMFFTRFADIVTNFESCSTKHGSLSSVDCHALALPDIRLSLSEFKQAMKADSVGSFDFDIGVMSQKIADLVAGVSPKQEQMQNPGNNQIVQELQISLQREQERALHWQNLYLLQRRQREWERENEDLEDQRERAQWEKEDEEEDRKMRERWEREEAENDRKERLLWEREDQEQDRRERERWEKERADLNDLECLKKLMSANLTFLRQHVMNWNVSAFDDFVNMSLLMSSIADMKQSVLASVQQIWVEAEEALNRMGDDVKNGKQSYLDTSVMTDYLKQALAILQSQFDDVVSDYTDGFNEKEKPTLSKDFDSKRERNQENPKVNYNNFAKDDLKTETGLGVWNKMIGNVFKKTSKSLRKFVRTVSYSWSKVMSLWEKKASNFMKTGKTDADTEGSSEVFSFPSWLKGKSCQHLSNKQNVIVDIGSPCFWDVRDSFIKLLLEKPCDHHNRYSLVCNINSNSVWQLKRDLTKILEVDARYRANKMASIDETHILGLFSDFWKKWASSELLLKYDKDWTSCLLREWSKVVYSKGGWTKSCHRVVDLNKVFIDIDTRTNHPNDQTKKPMESDDVHRDEKGGIIQDEYDETEKNTHTYYFGENYDDTGDDINDYETVDNTVSEYYKHVNRESHDSPLSKKNSQDHKHQTHTRGNMSDNDISAGHGYKQTEWYQKRAQYRLEMRRAQEKASWFFELSDHRDEMRKEHNTEKMSGQWLFDQAEERESQRKKDQEVDWVFERAHHRREESDRKWSRRHQPRRRQDHEDNDEDDEYVVVRGRQKMKDLSVSDWLLQNNGCGRHRGNGIGGRKAYKRGKYVLKNAKKIKHNFKNKNKSDKKNKAKGKKTHRPHNVKQKKQHKNRKHFHKKSPKK